MTLLIQIYSLYSVIWNGITYDSSGIYSYNGGNNPLNVPGLHTEDFCEVIITFQIHQQLGLKEIN